MTTPDTSPGDPEELPTPPEQRPWHREEHPAPGQPSGPPPHYAPPRRQGFWSSTPGILLILFGALLLFCFGRGAISRSGGDSGGPDVSVDIVSCTFYGDRAAVELEVTNDGDETGDARIEIEYRDGAGKRIDTDTTWVRDIAPGDTVRTEESTLLDASASSGRCIVTEVS